MSIFMNHIIKFKKQSDGFVKALLIDANTLKRLDTLPILINKQRRSDAIHLFKQEFPIDFEVSVIKLNIKQFINNYPDHQEIVPNQYGKGELSFIISVKYKDDEYLCPVFDELKDNRIFNSNSDDIVFMENHEFNCIDCGTSLDIYFDINNNNFYVSPCPKCSK